MAGDEHACAEMLKHDLDGDGHIGIAGPTLEAERAIRDRGNDTGRTLATFLAIPLTEVLFTILFTVLCGGEWALKKQFPSHAC